MDKSKSTKLEVDPYWAQFVAEGLVQKSINSEDFLVPHTELLEYSDQYPKQALKTLKTILTAEAHRKLDSRWRKYKHSAKHNTTTLTIKRETLQRLKSIARKSGFKEENYDLILEYLMDPEDELASAKQSVGQDDLPTGLNINEKQQLLRAKLRFRDSTYRYMLSLIEHAFTMGFLVCKRMHHATRKKDTALAEATSEYMDSVKGL